MFKTIRAIRHPIKTLKTLKRFTYTPKEATCISKTKLRDPEREQIMHGKRKSSTKINQKKYFKDIKTIKHDHRASFLS